jgi:UDP-3-O-[3-hydroxymyristoyl] glucosamine N-acyltransferase
MRFTAVQIAELVQGTIVGDPNAEVYTVAKIEEGFPGSLAFLANPKYTPHLYTTGASIVLVREDLHPEKPVDSTLIRVKDPYTAFARLLEVYQQKSQPQAGVSPLAYVHPSAVLGENCYVGEFAWIGQGVVIGQEVKIYPQVYLGDRSAVGDHTIIYPGVKAYHDTQIGAHCILHAGVILGADGFGFAPQSDQHYLKVPQIGNVVLEDHVEIGANTTVDRATLGSTIIRKGVKLDNLVQVGHNVEIGEDTVIAAQTGISGSTHIGKRCLIAGQVGMIGHIRIADRVTIGAQSGVSASIPDEGAIVMGSPAIDASLYKRILVWFRKLPELGTRVSQLEKGK